MGRLAVHLVFFAAITRPGCVASTPSPDPPPDEPPLTAPAAQDAIPFRPPGDCGGCHRNIFAQWSGSMHAKAYSNPVFQAALRKANDDAESNPNFRPAARGCLACHSPVTYLKLAQRVSAAAEGDEALTGVICDFCHSVRGYRDPLPASANYIAWPTEAKLGPFVYPSFHSQYSKLHTQAEFCGICHDGTTPTGAQFRTTFTEWKNGPYPALNIQCQDCHMNNRGFLVAGKATYESGKAAVIDADIPHREKIYSHRFPGAYSDSQIEKALTMEIKAAPSALEPGSKVTIEVFVTNAKAGHKVPTGSSEVRMMWLEVTAGPAGAERWLPATSAGGDSTWDVAGFTEEDTRTMRNDIPDGARVYRAVFFDREGQQAFTVHEVFRMVFDNRIGPKETRKESYSYVVPSDFPKDAPLEVRARIFYRLYPSSFTKLLELPDRPAIEVSSATLTLKRSSAPPP